MRERAGAPPTPGSRAWWSPPCSPIPPPLRAFTRSLRRDSGRASTAEPAGRRSAVRSRRELWPSARAPDRLSTREFAAPSGRAPTPGRPGRPFRSFARRRRRRRVRTTRAPGVDERRVETQPRVTWPERMRRLGRLDLERRRCLGGSPRNAVGNADLEEVAARLQSFRREGEEQRTASLALLVGPAEDLDVPFARFPIGSEDRGENLERLHPESGAEIERHDGNLRRRGPREDRKHRRDERIACDGEGVLRHAGWSVGAQTGLDHGPAPRGLLEEWREDDGRGSGDLRHVHARRRYGRASCRYVSHERADAVIAGWKRERSQKLQASRLDGRANAREIERHLLADIVPERHRFVRRVREDLDPGLGSRVAGQKGAPGDLENDRHLRESALSRKGGGEDPDGKGVLPRPAGEEVPGGEELLERGKAPVGPRLVVPRAREDFRSGCLDLDLESVERAGLGELFGLVNEEVHEGCTLRDTLELAAQLVGVAYECAVGLGGHREEGVCSAARLGGAHVSLGAQSADVDRVEDGVGPLEPGKGRGEAIAHRGAAEARVAVDLPDLAGYGGGGRVLRRRRGQRGTRRLLQRGAAITP